MKYTNRIIPLEKIKKRSMYPFTLDENVKQNRHHYAGPVTYELKELYQEKF